MDIREQKTQFFAHQPRRETAVSHPTFTPASPTTNLPETIWIPLPEKKRRRWQLIPVRAIVLGTVLAMLVILFGTAVGGAVLLTNSPIIFPNVTVLDVPVGTQTRAEAAVTLQSAWQQEQIVLATADRQWQVTPSDLGISLDVPATIDRAYGYGRSWASGKKSSPIAGRWRCSRSGKLI